MRLHLYLIRRQTHAELLRCLNELIHPRVSHLTEDQLREQDASYLATLKRKTVLADTPIIPRSEVVNPGLTHDQELLAEKWARMLAMIEKGKSWA